MTGSHRALSILRQLEKRWCRVKPLAEQFGTSEKSIRRDFLTIQRAGFRLAAED